MPRLHEWEEGGARAHAPPLAEQGSRHGLERAFEIGERDALVDRQPLDLVEDGQVRRVEGLTPVDPTGCHHEDGGGCACIVRICTAEASVRSRSSGWSGTLTYNESFIVRAGWSTGMFSAWKLCQSSSTSGPLSHPEPEAP